MKKFAIFLLAALSVALFAPQAQAQGVTIGIKGGLNLASVTFKSDEGDLPDFKTQSGFVKGIFVNFKLGPVFIQPELLYSRMGTQWNEYSGEDAEVTGHMRLDYLELPILVKYSFLSGPVKPFVMAGPSLSYLVSSKWGVNVDITDNSSEPDYSYYYDYSDYFKKTDFAAVFAIGFDYQLPKFVVSLEARYHLGLTNVASADLVEESYSVSIKNRAFSVLVGIGF